MSANWGGAASGAMSGAGAGAALGPWGAAAGGLAGGLMGLFGGQKTPMPDAPNWNQAAEKTSEGSRPNTGNALGGQTWTTDPSGRQQSTMAYTGQAGDAFKGLLGGMQKSSTIDPTLAGQQAFDKVYNQGASRLNPQWDALSGAFDAKMANSGTGAETVAGQNAARIFGNQRTDAYGDLTSRSVGAGQAEQAQARANANQPFQQAGMMQDMLMQQAPNYGQGTNYTEAAKNQWQSDLDKYSGGQAQQQGQQNGMFGGMGDMFKGVGGMFASKATPAPAPKQQWV